MKLIADTNVLLRAALQDDPVQSPLAARTLQEAEQIIVSRHALCEFVWVLGKRYRFSKADIAASLLHLLSAGNVVTDGIAFETGLLTMNSGADFADGVIAHEGRQLGGDTFVSFDRKAVTALAQQGINAQLLE